MSKPAEAPVIRRVDYTPPAFLIDTVELEFDLAAQRTRVRSTLRVRRNPDAPHAADLELAGDALELLSLSIDGQPHDAVRVRDDGLVVSNVPETFELTIENACRPADNTTLSGLYVSNGNFFTQCEAEGFRRITYFLDRPDVMAAYRVTLRADRAAYPVLLSNGNLVDSGALPDGRHYAKWEDPFRKPSYLFALVAGKLVAREQTITTRSGSEKLLQVWVEPHDLDKTGHALDSLIRAIRWDEQRFGLELDLERFMIVAVGDFNMGAMENKLSLKEGLTVFRDQAFSADMAGGATDPAAAAVKRIDDVRVLRQMQFAEDAGPMAHPVRPESYVEVNNFYTVTVYEKGAELVRMYQTLFGRDGFRHGMDLYFQRHDGQARYGESSPDAAQTQKGPLQIPFALGLVDAHGRDMPLRLRDEPCDAAAATTRVLELTGTEQTFTFVDVAEKPLPSLLRNFSAPVIVEYDYTDDELAFLLAHDSDPFNRWEAGQRLATRALLSLATNVQQHVPLELPDAFVAAFGAVLRDGSLSPAFLEQALTLPSETYLAEQMDEADPAALHQARQFVRRTLAAALRDDWLAAYDAHPTPGEYTPNPADAGKRALKNLALHYLAELDAPCDALRLARAQFDDANNMTDRAAALAALITLRASAPRQADEAARAALDAFYRRHENDALVIDKWFALQAQQRGSAGRHAIDTVRELMRHPAFNLKNPNRARALIFSFCATNPDQFHLPDGSGYAFWAEQVIALDTLNPQVAARLARSLERWRKFVPALREPMRAALEKVAAKVSSKDVREIVDKALG
ncbi:hypothetical protein DFQ30_009463 [Apophysomyces sp. BC1015]|nr:hypothetical protein DFQ30_009463 [Apophysomyces sp. BC1015]